MKVKNRQTIFDIAIQEYGSIEDVFKLMSDNESFFNSQGLSTQIEPGAELLIKSESSEPAIQRYYKNGKIEVSTGISKNANVSVISAEVNDAYVDDTLTAYVIIENEGISTAIGEIEFDWGFQKTKVIAVFLLPGQEIEVSDSVIATAQMLGTSKLHISGVATYDIDYKVKGKATFIQSNALQVTTDSVIQLYDSVITIQASSLSSLGTAVVSINNNRVEVSEAGTLYDIEFTDTSGNQYRIPCAEGSGWTLHDVKQAKRAIVNNHTWTKQNTLHYNLNKGVTKLDNGIYVPYSETNNKIYNDL